MNDLTVVYYTDIHCIIDIKKEIEMTNYETLQRICERAKEKVHCVKKGNYYYIKVPGINENDPEDIVGIYRHEDFAKKKYEAIKAGCKISVCSRRGGIFR